MKRILMIILAALLLLLLLGYAFRDSLRNVAIDYFTREMFVSEDADDFDPGPATGSHFPGVNATWQGRNIRLLQEFAGANGTVFVATRSANWCPYCMRQMIQLQEHKAAYDAAGIGIVAMTYDDPELQAAFIDKWDIQYPILHDVDTLSFRTLGILNEDYEPGDFAYGIPHPGMIIIDPQGIVVGKLFLESYSQRVDSLAALAIAKRALGLGADTAPAPPGG